MQSGKEAQKPGGRHVANSTDEAVEVSTHTDGKASNCSLKGHSARTEAGPSALDFEVQ